MLPNACTEPQHCIWPHLQFEGPCLEPPLTRIECTISTCGSKAMPAMLKRQGCVPTNAKTWVGGLASCNLRLMGSGNEEVL
eukprot:2175528-Amphidinium_carterae.1